MKDLIEDIRKKEFQKVYLLCGEEPYLRQLYKKKLTEAVLPEGSHRPGGDHALLCR